MYNKKFSYKDVFTLADILKSAKYLGKEGYFADDYDTLEDMVKSDKSNVLDALLPKQVQCFNSSESRGRSLGDVNYGLFLPKEKVCIIEPEEPKWRPYTIKEFKNKYKVGDIITYREKLCPHRVYTSMITCIEEQGGDRPDVIWFGARKEFLDSMFETLEILDIVGWTPFGILDY